MNNTLRVKGMTATNTKKKKMEESHSAIFIPCHLFHLEETAVSNLLFCDSK